MVNNNFLDLCQRLLTAEDVLQMLPLDEATQERRAPIAATHHVTYSFGRLNLGIESKPTLYIRSPPWASILFLAHRSG